MSGQVSLAGKGLVVGYGGAPVLDGVDFAVPSGQFTVIVGPNACGKSTLLKTLSRVLRPSSGQVELGGRPLSSYSPKQVARQVALLPQSPQAPEGISVADLVARGRHPHQSLLRQWSPADERAVQDALERAGVANLADRRVEELSGGQRQRVWIAMALAQDTPVLLLDEPTTYLDISHQVEVLELAAALQRQGRTVVAVLHELALAFRYATHLVVMHQGAIVAQGRPREIVTEQLIEKVFDLPCQLLHDPQTGAPLVLPRPRKQAL